METSATIEVEWAETTETREVSLDKIRITQEIREHLIITAVIWGALILKTIIEVRMIDKEETRAF